MTTLADLTPGTQFLMACQVVSVDETGMTLALFGSASDSAAQGLISPTGAITGQLTTEPDEVQVSIVTGLVPVAVGDVLTNDSSGETYVAQWASLTPDGIVKWSSSANHQVIYSGDNWTIVGHVDL